MNSTVTMDGEAQMNGLMPGAYLKQQRESRGLTPEYVATKLHLRVKVVLQLESDDYPNMPEAVFVKGYIRAYAKILGVSSDTLLNAYNQLFPSSEQKSEKVVWQSKRQKYKSERAMRWMTGLFVAAAVTTVAIWWGKTNDMHTVVSHVDAQNVKVAYKKHVKVKPEDVNQLKQLLSVDDNVSLLEKGSAR